MKRPGDPLVRQQSDQFLLTIAEEELLSLETEIIRLNEKNESLQAVIESKQKVINKWIDSMDRLMEFSENRNSDDKEELDEATHLNDDESISLAKIRGLVKESKHFFTEDVAPRWASNHGPLHGNYRDE